MQGRDEPHRVPPPQAGAAVSQTGRWGSTTVAAAALGALYVVCLVAAPAPAFVAPGEGASWLLMTSLAANGWTGAALDTFAARIDPQGAFADGFTRARGGRWYSKAPPLLPLAASLLYGVLGTLGAYAVSAGSAIAGFLIAARIGRSLMDGTARETGAGTPAALGAVAATPLVVHGALFCGHAAAAALILGAAALFMDSCAKGFPAARGCRRPLAGAGLCAALAALAQPEAIWFGPSAIAAWAVLKEGRPRVAVAEGAKWRVAFLALASAAHVAVCLLVSSLSSGDTQAWTWGAEWGSPILLPVIAPAALAVYGLVAAAGRSGPSLAARTRQDRISLVPARFVAGASRIGSSLAVRARPIWIGLVAAGLLVQAAGVRSVLAARAANARVIAAVEEAAQPGDAIASDAAGLPALAATLAPTRAVLHLGAGGGAPEDLLFVLGNSDVRVLAVVSRAADASEGGEPLAVRRAIGGYLREGEPHRVGAYLVARFTGAGSDSWRPSAPPRGD